MEVTSSTNNVMDNSFWMFTPTLNLDWPIYSFVVLRLGVGYQLTFGDSWTADNDQPLQGVPSDLNGNTFLYSIWNIYRILFFLNIMKNILLTGGAGFIGSNFINYILDEHSDYNIINLDKLTYAGNLENLVTSEGKKNYKFVKGDITNAELVNSLFQKYDINYVINFAAESHVDRSILDSEIFFRSNVLGTNVLLEAARKFK